MFLKLRASEMKISAYVVVIGFSIISLCQITYSTDDHDDLNYLDDVDTDDYVDITPTPSSAHYAGKEYFAVITLKHENGSSIDQNGVIEGDSVEFHCTYKPANASLELESTYNFARTDLEKYVQQGNESILALKNVTLEDAGVYKCELNGPIGVLHSHRLFMAVKPKYPKQSNDTTDDERYWNIEYGVEINVVLQQGQYSLRDIVIGSNLVFECKIYGTKSNRKYQFVHFFHNGTRIIPGENKVFSVDDSITRLTIKRINKTASGKYSCEFFTGEKLVPSRKHYDLIVHDKPPRCLEGPWSATLKVSGSLTNRKLVTVDEFSDVNFTCEIAPSDTIVLGRKWFRTETELLLNPTAGIEFIDSDLHLKQITTAFAGTYKCEIEIEPGRLCSNEIWFRVAKLKEKTQEEMGSWHEALKSLENSKNSSQKSGATYGVVKNPNYSKNPRQKSRETYGVLKNLTNSKPAKDPSRKSGDLFGMLKNLLTNSKDSSEESESDGEMDTVKPKLHVKLGDELKIKQIYEWDDVYLTCSVEPNTAVVRKFTWFQDGRILLSNRKLHIDSKGSTLRLTRISKKSIGKYICQGQNSKHRVYSDPFLLPVVKAVNNVPGAQPSAFLRRSIELTGENVVYRFNDTSLFCDVQPSKTILTRRWFRNGKKMSENKKHGIHFNGSALQFTRIEKHSQAYYMCQVETDSDIILYSSYFRLHVHDKQYIPQNEKDKVQLVIQLGYSLELDDIRESDDIYFTCLLQPKIIDYRSVQWVHDVLEIHRSRSPFIEYGNSTLILKNIQKNQSGRYYCRAETDAGFLISEELDIKVKPKSEKPRTDMSPDVSHAVFMEVANGIIPGRVIEFDDVYLICYIVSDSIPDNYTFDWSHDQSELRRRRESSNKVIILRHYRRLTLIVLRIDQGFSGKFTGHVAFSDESGRHEYKTHGVEIGEVREFVTNVPPTVRATFKGTEEKATIKETHAAFFTCDIKPYEMNIRRIHWIHNGTLLNTKLSELDNFEIMKGFETLLLKRANKASAGRYQCEVETELAQVVMSNIVTISIEGSKENDTNSAVENPLVFAYLDTRPQWIFKNRKTTSVTCYVFPLQYQHDYTISRWFLNGVLVRNIRNSQQYSYKRHVGFEQLEIIRISEFYTGNYTCEIRLKNGKKITGYPAQLLKVHDKPNRKEVYSYPDYQTVIAELQNDPNDIYVNDTVYFYCVIKSHIEVTMFRWFFNLFDSNDVYNIPNPEKHRKDPGNGTYFSSDNRTLILRQVQNIESTVGNYTCEAETYLGIYKSKPTRLPLFNEEPNDDRDYWSKGNVELFVETVDLELDFIHETDDVELACTVKPESTAIIKIEWRFNNQTILPKEMTLHNNRTLIIRNINNSFAGNYTCHANTKKGYLISKHLPLVVKPCISLTAELQDNFESDFYEGDYLYIYCDIQPNTTKYRNIQWYHNGFKLKGWYPVQSMQHFGEIIQIRDLKKHNLGSYTCRIETPENITYRSFPGQLSELKEGKYHNYSWDTGAPFQKTQLLDGRLNLSKIYEGMNVWLYCDVKPKSTFIFSVEWNHNGSSFPDENENRDFHFQYASNKQMVRLLNITSNYSGTYECVLDSKKGKILREPNDPAFILQVKPKPISQRSEIQDEIQNISSLSGIPT